jgi:hypothetical protein
MTRVLGHALALCGAALIAMLGFTAGHAVEARKIAPAMVPGEAPSSPLTLDRGILAAAIPAALASARPSPDDCAPTPATWLARMAVGERDDVLATGRITDDHRGILQVARNVAAGRGVELGPALRALAPRLHGDRPQSRRQAWVAGLPACGDAPPTTWRDCRGHPEDCDGDWRLYRAGWASVRAWAQWALRDGERGPCPGTPIAYGCSDCDTPGGCCDDAFALRRGLCRLDCGGMIAFWSRCTEGKD